MSDPGVAAAAAPPGGALGALLAGARAASRQAPGAAGGKRKSGGGGAVASTTKRRSEAPAGSSFEACPLCGRGVHRALLEAHASACGGASPAAAPSVPPPACAPPPHADADAPAAAAPEAPPAAAPCGAPSAFAVLLASAAETARRAAPTIFSLDLLEDGTFAARWSAAGTSSPPPGDADVAWRDTLDVRDKTSPGGVARVVLRTNVPSAPAPFPWPPPPRDGRCRLAAGPLKSAVQKCVRLCRPAAAVRAAAALAELDAQEALRRLVIIAVEDAIVPPDALSLLTWLMAAASKRYVPSAAHWAAVLRAVHEMAAVGVRDPIHAADAADVAAAPPSLGAPPEGLDALPGREGATVRSLLLRAAFGGMGGDVAMLRAAAAVWTRRFAGQAGSPPGDPSATWQSYLDTLFAALPPAEHVAAAATHDSTAQLAALPPLRLRDVPPSAIDFHCSNIVTDVLADAALPAAAMEALHAAGEPIDAFKTAMWRYRSGLNAKRRLRGGGVGGGEQAVVDAAAADEDASEGGGDDVALRRAWAAVQPLVELHTQRFLRRSFY